MTALLDPDAEEIYAAEVFTTLTGVELDDSAESWRSETRLELLAWEIARYEPALAERLAEAGRRALLTA